MINFFLKSYCGLGFVLSLSDIVSCRSLYSGWRTRKLSRAFGSFQQYFPESKQYFSESRNKYALLYIVIINHINKITRVFLKKDLLFLKNHRNWFSDRRILASISFIFCFFWVFLKEFFLIQTRTQIWRGSSLKNWNLHLRYWQKTALNRHISSPKNRGFSLSNIVSRHLEALNS